jgi:ParB family chromosome partitioning protein
MSVDSDGKKIELSNAAVKKGLSVRALERLVGSKKSPKKRQAAVDNDIRMLEERIQERLGTRVRIVRGKKRGTIQIEYYSNEDLDRILRVLDCAS